MSTLTVKGQVTIPKAVRDHLGVGPGEAVDFAVTPDGEVVLRAGRPRRKKPVKSRFSGVRGVIEQGVGTDEFMSLLRGFDEDEQDPGLR
jgi:antitoxin PrlF